LPAPERDQQLVLPRQFKSDLCWRDRHLFVECDGAEWSSGQHARGQGMTDDCVKWNLLTLDGWRGLRFTGSQVKSGYALATLERALERYPVSAS
jgi:very-short-patch-repair endonuclease